MIPLFQPYVNDAARANVQRVLSGTQLAEGPEVKLFEEELAKTFGFEPWQIVTLNSGTSALELAYDIVGIEEGDHVITPVLTCTATNIPLVRRKAKIIFADIEGRTTLNIDPNDVKRKITGKTKAIVFVHFGGSSSGLEEVRRIAEESRIDFIADGAQALGSSLSQLARFTTISLQAIKSLTSGDGGVLICREREDALLARKLRWYGYDREEKQRLGDTDLLHAGYKMHMSDITAAIGRGNLSEWSRIEEHRRGVNEVYRQWGQGKGYIEGIWNPQVVGMDYEEAKEKLLKRNVMIGQYHYPNYKYTLFRNADADVPRMHALENNYFMLPCHMGMTILDAADIGSALWG